MAETFEEFVTSLQATINNSFEDKKIPAPAPAHVPVPAHVPAPVPVPTNVLSHPIKFMLVSTHINQTTGYAKVTYNILKELVKHQWITVHHYAIQGFREKGIREYPSTVKIHDAVSLEDGKKAGFGFSELGAVVMKEKPDIIMIYNDLGVISQYLNELRKLVDNGTERTWRIWLYADQVYKTQPRELIDIVNREVDRVFCFTNEWRTILRKQGMHRPIDILPHGFDGTVFGQIPRKLARQAARIPEDIFIFLSLNRNQPRKRLDLLIMAFVELIVRNPTRPLFLMMICDKGERGGYQIFDIFARELRQRGASPEQFGGRLMLSAEQKRYTDEEINVLYNVANVGVSCADGEGFGLCAFEQMGVGVPQVLSNVVGHSEYCNEKNSILVPCKFRYYLPSGYCPTGGEAEAVDPIDFSRAMERYVHDENILKVHGAAARDTVLEYSWEKVVHILIQRILQVSKEEI